MRSVISWAERLKWGASRVPGSAAKLHLSQLISTEDFPGTGWRVIDERAWRTGTSGAEAAWASRAKAAGLVTAWRSFEQKTPERWVWIQVTPLATEADAQDALHAVPDRFLGNVRSDVTVVDGEDAEPVVVDGSSAGWAHEQRTSSRRGDGIALCSAFVVGRSLVVLAASGFEGSWTWAEVGQAAQIQAARLAR